VVLHDALAVPYLLDGIIGPLRLLAAAAIELCTTRRQVIVSWTSFSVAHQSCPMPSSKTRHFTISPIDVTNTLPEEERLEENGHPPLLERQPMVSPSNECGGVANEMLQRPSQMGLVRVPGLIGRVDQRNALPQKRGGLFGTLDLLNGLVGESG